MQKSPLRTVSSVGLIGFGAFGQLIARHLHPHFPLRIYDQAGPAGMDDIAAAGSCDLVILAVPVSALAPAIAALRPHLKPGATVMDVGSVKLEPARLMVEGLPDHVDIVGTHPLFGPQSARDGIAGHKIAVCPVRGTSAPRIAAFLRRALGLKVIVSTADRHDREAAIVQGLTHLIAKVLTRMEPLPTELTTASFDLLMQATAMVRDDAASVFHAIEHQNPHAAPVRARFLELVEELRGGVEGVG